MSRARSACLVGILAVVCAPGALRAESMPPELQQLLEAVERDEAANHYAAAYVRLMQVQALAKQGNHPAALERVGELEPFLASASRRQVWKELDRYLRAQATARPELGRQLGSAAEAGYPSACAYDESTHSYACSASLDGGTFRCVADEGTAVRCGAE